jgi:hypothetical protein
VEELILPVAKKAMTVFRRLSPSAVDGQLKIAATEILNQLVLELNRVKVLVDMLEAVVSAKKFYKHVSDYFEFTVGDEQRPTFEMYIDNVENYLEINKAYILGYGTKELFFRFEDGSEFWISPMAYENDKPLMMLKASLKYDIELGTNSTFWVSAVHDVVMQARNNMTLIADNELYLRAPDISRIYLCKSKPLLQCWRLCVDSNMYLRLCS